MNRYENLPPAIAAKLDESVRRVRHILRVRGVCITVAVFVAALLAMMAIDAMVMIFSSAVRWGLWSAAVGVVGWTAWTSLVKPLRRKLTAAEIAALIERNHPELEERLTTVVELVQSGDGSSSRSLMESLTLDAVRDAGGVRPTEEFTTRTVKPRLVAAAVALGILAVLFVAFPKATARLVTRAIIPSAEVDNVYASSLKVAPGDAVLLAGSPFSVSLAVDEGFPDKAYVRTRFEGARGESAERMTRTSAPGERNAFYTFDYPSVDRSFAYRVNCGSALTRSYAVTVVPVPSFSERRILVTHPEYTGRPPDAYTNTAEIAALAGSTVTVSVRPDRDDLAGVALLPRRRQAKGVPDGEGRLNFAFALGANDNGEWGIALTDRYGFSNGVEKAAVRITRDEPPQITVLEPVETSMELPPYGQVPFSCEIAEDYGIAGAEIEMSVGGAGFTNVTDLVCSPSGDRRWTGDTSFELSRVTIPGGAVVRLRLAVKDNCPRELGGPHVTYSPEYTIRIVARADTLDVKMLADEIKSAGLDVNEAKKALSSARRQLEEASRQVDQKEEWKRKQGESQLKEAAKKLQKAEDILKELTREDPDDLLALARQAMKSVLDEYVTPDRQAAEDILMTERDKERSQPAEELAKRVDDAVKALDEAQKAFDDAANEAAETQKLAEMSEREESLAEMAENDEITADELAARQQELEQKFERDFKARLKAEAKQNEERANDSAKTGEQFRNAEQFREMRDQMNDALTTAQKAARAERANEKAKGRNGEQQQQQDVAQQMKDAARQMKAAARQMRGRAQKNAEKQNRTLADFLPPNGEGDPKGDVNDKAPPPQQSFRTRRTRRAASRQDPAVPDGVLDWFKMKSNSTSGAESAPLDDIPAEYRGLVRDYFKALNEGSAK